MLFCDLAGFLEIDTIIVVDFSVAKEIQDKIKV